MADRMDEDMASWRTMGPLASEGMDAWIAIRMREACSRLIGMRGPAFRLGDDGELKAGAVSVAMRGIGSDVEEPATALVAVLPGSEQHLSRHTLALQFNPHALIVHGAGLAAVPDGTLVLMQPIDLRLHDTVALAAALGRFVELTFFLLRQLALPNEVSS